MRPEILAVAMLFALAACHQQGPVRSTLPAGDPSASAPPPEWALVIHGGAGVISRDQPEERIREYHQALEAALRLGQERLAAGGRALDVVEEVVALLEDEPLFNAGRGAVFTHQGRHELDASIMEGRTLGAGAVTGVTTVKNPIRLARMVMERSRHIFFAGDGAEAFATEMGVERVANEHFSTPHRREALERAIEQERREAAEQEAGATGTVGAVALDRHGNLAAATSTGGLTNKRFGRIGDSPVIGAGTYADNRSAAISGTGAGEQFIRHTVARTIAALVELQGRSLQEAAEEVVHRRLEPGDGGVIAVSHRGEIAMVFSSPGMFRGAADSSGRFEVAIWDEGS